MLSFQGGGSGLKSFLIKNSHGRIVACVMGGFFQMFIEASLDIFGYTCIERIILAKKYVEVPHIKTLPSDLPLLPGLCIKKRFLRGDRR